MPNPVEHTRSSLPGDVQNQNDHLRRAVRACPRVHLDAPAEVPPSNATIGENGSAPTDPSAMMSRLSLREREVAGLVAKGLSDRDISSVLVISRRTAESHVAHILAKLGFSSRVQVATCVALTALTGDFTDPVSDRAPGSAPQRTA